MASGKQTPRQKMINMMYLVLTAMLALNVSAEIVDAFAKIERGLDQTVIITDRKNDNTLAFFENAFAELGKKAEEWRNKAKIARDKTKEIKDYIQSLKIELIKEADGQETSAVRDGKIFADSIGKKDDLNVANQILLGSNNNGKAYELHQKVLEYKEFILKEVVGGNAEIESFINELLDFSDSKQGLTVRDWETFTFNSTPLISAIALLSKMQVDILNCESYVQEYLKSRIGKDDLKISNIEAAVSNPNGMIMKGSSGEAEVFLVAFDESIQAEAHINGRTVPMKGGRAKIPFSGANIGPSTVAGSITYRNSSGETERRNFKFEYYVVEPSLAVSPTKMNVFYLGVENPVDISVSGVSQKDININITNGTMTPAGQSGSYIVRPTTQGECNISVTATVNGEQKNMGTRKFRVKRVPNPEPSLFNITGKSVSRSQLSAVQGVVAKMPSDFDFDLPFDVLSFTIEVVQKNNYISAESSNSQQFTEAQRRLMMEAKVGSKLYITDIKVKAKGINDVRELPSITYQISN
jgi:gliding motility-associated protein GldM